VRKGILHIHGYLPPLVSIEATGLCIPIGNSEVLLAAVCKFPGHAWNDTDISELLSFRHKSLFAGDLNAKHPFWNSVVSNPSGPKLLNLLHLNKFEISAPQYSTQYSPTGNGDVLDIVVLWLSEVIASDILDSDHLQIVLHLLDYIRTRSLSDPVEKFTDWKWFQSLASELISPRIQVNSEDIPGLENFLKYKRTLRKLASNSESSM
jgi:hypothetical protein